MNPTNHVVTGLRPPPRPSQERSQSTASHRSASSLSSNDSQHAAQTAVKRTAHPSQVPPRPSTAGGATAPASSSNLTNFSRPAPRVSIEDQMRGQRPHAASSGAAIGHRPRQHSQGFFEPSLPTASASTLSASAIAAATAMNHLGPASLSMNDRKRSMPGLAPLNTSTAPPRRAPSPTATSPPYHQRSHDYPSNPENGKLTATTAANVAYPKSPIPNASTTSMDDSLLPPVPPLVPEKEGKGKEKSKMKLFSKPKTIGINKDKDLDKKLPSLPSPNKRGFPPGIASTSTTSLLDSTMSSSASIYSTTTSNNSTSTLVPNPSSTAVNLDKEKHRPHFLSRQKHKHGEKFLPLSSASSNSQAVDPSAPSSLYSFTPQSPGANSAFSKSVTGLDLRHGGRGLRDKRKEEKAAASSGMSMAGSSMNVNTDYRSEFSGPSSLGETFSFLGPPSGTSASVFSFDQNPTASAAAFNNLGNNMGLSGITPDDAWPLLKARLLNIFEGEDIRTPVEDFNLLVSVHIRRCVQKRAPHVLVEDLREFLETGFASLAQTLRNLPDERLVPNLAEMWQMIYCVVLPFIQAVFLPLDQEFRGHGLIMTTREAAEFWGAMPDTFRSEERPGSAGGANAKALPSLGEELDVRRMTLISFRDTVLLPRADALLMIFSRLSLDSINAGPSDSIASRSRGGSNPTAPGAERPSTSAGSLSPRLSSYSSQTSTLLDAAANSSPSQSGVFSSNRSRATSNTSAGSFGTSLPHLPSPLHPPPQATSTPGTSTPSSSGQIGTGHSRSRSAISVPEPTTASLLTSTSTITLTGGMQVSSAQVTETVARMLQCVSILAGVQTGDQGQGVLERLTGVLKHNWLGRGRTGRQRKGFVGMRVGGGTLVGTA
ncbi:HbrB-like-domain-containing protein [Elsinoe ampelina]|uniref:HbrB-like-domain-containing protein n=1 Tax=Elsinoe ampelina TaxID=302913 RepID=A0A6A6FXK8_9PEZI|nr:HbrB-like-domain-containing protein [Elsinoe ampelina]